MRVPLIYKPGIQRDGTDFQDQYCIDGQWIRFVNGQIKKMKGNQEIYKPQLNVTHMDIYNAPNNYVLIYTSNSHVNRCITDLNVVSNDKEVLTLQSMPNRTWQSLKFIGKDGNPYLALLATFNGSNMLSSTNGVLYWKSMVNDEEFITYTDEIIPGNTTNIVSGGILFSNPCLYLYGNNGTIIRSRTDDPLNFEGGDSGVYKISENKLIFGASIRGGNNSPSFLFWTQNSVIYLTNVADPANTDQPVDFQREEITTNSSLMSSRAIVQYDSLFFWLGTDRVFVYNGIVDSIKNDVNFEYFLENVDLSKRQKIYGYKIARYGEVRWAYPEKIYKNNPTVGCTRELVYNVRENSWYDTAIRRDCVTVYEATGDILSYGESCINYPYAAENSYNSIWKQEIGYNEVRLGGQQNNIPSFFTTPYFGFVAFNPAKNGNAVDKYIVLDQIEPDFPAPFGYQRTADDELVIGVSYKKYASTPTTSITPLTYSLYPNTSPGKIDLRVSARFMTVTFACVYPYNVGTILINYKEGSNQ
jgi:hypothetical protein